MATPDPESPDLEVPSPQERRDLDGMLRMARRMIDPPRVLSPLEVAIVAILGERFDLLTDGNLTGETWTAQELAESIEAQMEEQRGRA